MKSIYQAPGKSNQIDYRPEDPNFHMLPAQNSKNINAEKSEIQ
jgi:hypothetical protein